MLLFASRADCILAREAKVDKRGPLQRCIARKHVYIVAVVGLGAQGAFDSQTGHIESM